MPNVTSIVISSIDTSNLTNIQSIFRNCSNLEQIKIGSLESVNENTTSFAGLTKLKKFRMESGSFSSLVDWDFSTSPLLTIESARNIMAHMPVLEEGVSRTLTFHADVLSLLTEQEKEEFSLTTGWTLGQ